MIETIIIAFLFSKIKGYEIKNLFKTWHIYPMVLLELLYFVGQVMIFNGNYEYVKLFASMKSIYLCSYLFLVFKHEIYTSAIFGAGCVILGGILNDLAIKANNGFMPVYPTLSYLTGYAKPEGFNIINDIHILGNADVKLKFLTDYIDLGYSILSIGDILIRVLIFLIIYNSIKSINEKTKEKVKC